MTLHTVSMPRDVQTLHVLCMQKRLTPVLKSVERCTVFLSGFGISAMIGANTCSEP